MIRHKLTCLHLCKSSFIKEIVSISNLGQSLHCGMITSTSIGIFIQFTSFQITLQPQLSQTHSCFFSYPLLRNEMTLYIFCRILNCSSVKQSCSAIYRNFSISLCLLIIAFTSHISQFCHTMQQRMSCRNHTDQL